jgi:carotenoid cleavage dioxygenase
MTTAANSSALPRSAGPAPRWPTLTYRDFHAALEQNAQLSVRRPRRLSGDAMVLGRLPERPERRLFRNGPGRFELGGERYHHWFDGDGFAQRWQIGGGKVSHAGRFVATRKFEEESKAGRSCIRRSAPGSAARASRTTTRINSANTNLLPFNGAVYALWEGGSATELDPQTLATRGIKTWRSDLKAMPFSAHPKMDPDGGLWNFGTAPGADQLVIYRLNAKGEVARTAILPVPQLNMVHDFVVSGRHLIFLLAPYDFSPARAQPARLPAMGGRAPADARGGGPRTRWRCARCSNCRRARYSIRECVRRRRLHPIRRGAARGRRAAQDHAGCAARCAWCRITRARCRSRWITPAGRREARLFGASEFPRVAPQVVSARHRKLLVLGASGRDLTLDSVNLIDTDSGKVDGYAFGAGWQVEEHVLVPRRGARSEADGYVVGVAQDTHHGQTC